jgi:uncharacterized protein YdeI (YjbR/CyaY-like superfamily)
MAKKTSNPDMITSGNIKSKGVDSYLSRTKKWKQEQTVLRELILKNPLTETLKWGTPCYTLNNNNVVLIHAFKEYCALLFFKGALLNDTHGILIRQTENVQSSRQIRFTGVAQITELEVVLTDYVRQAIEVEKAGLTVTYKKTSEYKVPDEFKAILDKNKALKKAFEGLTPGRQRAYLLYFGQAKQSKTRVSRIEKLIPKILNGKGLND